MIFAQANKWKQGTQSQSLFTSQFTFGTYSSPQIVSMELGAVSIEIISEIVRDIDKTLIYNNVKIDIK